MPSQMSRNPNAPPPIDAMSGFCPETKIYHSLRSPVPLPQETAPLSVTDYVFSLINSFPSPPTVSALVDGDTGRRISSSQLISRTESLASSLRRELGLRKGDAAYILAPNSVNIPILYLSLLSLGVVLSPANPASSEREILHQLQLSKPRIAFATSAVAHKIPPTIKIVLLDSLEFESLAAETRSGESEPRTSVSQSDPAAILYSSGTTGATKGVILTHRNFTYTVALGHAVRTARKTPAVVLATVPFFHVYGFVFAVRAVALGETLVSMERVEMRKMLKAIEDHRITHVAAAPPLVVAMVKADRKVVDGYDLSSLEVVACGGAPLGRDVAAQLTARFPGVSLVQAYGLTESTGRVFSTVGPTESKVGGATGKLTPETEAKIVDPETGYVGDEEATARTLDAEGWLKTGDLCYIDDEGFLFVVDRIKELIKCRGYQVAPSELEHLLVSHPDILEAAVVPLPDERAGQVPIAFVVRQNGSTISELQVKEYIAKQVAPYKRLHRVLFTESLPKNAQGKLLRKDLTRLAMSPAKL
ncbi:unnamed protein product [Linum tenue]|uniref:4-coumarate--CoA ligase n=1 Tax=Linum tenue TaxID=586396 RepID=A0AAV0H7V9_9ROSI|nr:unnamed protein product [Linum tenue]